jgi:hypothetical protein
VDLVRVTASSPQGIPLFLGIATESNVDSWLRGTAHDELVGVYDDDEVRYDRSGGIVRGTGSPGEQQFWLASASGTGTVRLEWAPTDGEFAVVLANADGSAGVTASVTAAAKIPVLRPLGIGLLITGGLGLLAGIGLIYVGAMGLGGSGTPPGPVPPAPRSPRIDDQQRSRAKVLTTSG